MKSDIIANPTFTHTKGDIGFIFSGNVLKGSQDMIWHLNLAWALQLLCLELTIEGKEKLV